MKKWQSLIVTSLVVLLLVGASTLVLAQGNGGGDQAGNISVFGLIHNAGVIGYLIVALSIISVALIIEHFLSIQRDKLIPPDLVSEVDQLLQEEQYDEALDVCEMEPTFFTNVMAAGIAKLGMGMDEVDKSVQDTLESEQVRLQNKISWLSLIGNIAPMLGLLGTVIGMIQAFQQIAATRNPPPSKLAGGIYKALVTTTMGLIVGIPVLAFYFFFRNRLNQLISETGLVVEDILDQFKY